MRAVDILLEDILAHEGLPKFEKEKKWIVWAWDVSYDEDLHGPVKISINMDLYKMVC